MELLYALDNHYVVKRGRILFKLQPNAEPFQELRFSRMLLFSNRFCVWRLSYNQSIKRKMYKFCDIEDFEINQVKMLQCDFKGYDLQKILIEKSKCKCNKYKNSSATYNIKSNHLIFFKRYLIESVNILSELGIAHKDIYLRNIVVDLTKEEKANHEISVSLPILIDFGMAEFVGDEAKLSNLNSLTRLISTCNHGHKIVQLHENWAN